jgi:hypothetical protein
MQRVLRGIRAARLPIPADGSRQTCSG